MAAYELRFVIEDISLQKSVSLKRKAGAFLREQGVKVRNESHAAVTAHYAVQGVDLETQEAFTQLVEATDPEAAKDRARSKTRVVTEARPA